MSPRTTALHLIGSALAVGSALTASFAQEEVPPLDVPAGWDRASLDLEALEAYRCPPPVEFASVFSFGYVKDSMPKDDEAFARLLVTIKDLGFNVIHTTHTPRRQELCREHGVKLMVDLLSDAHSAHPFRELADDRAETLARSLRGAREVWGYNLWNDGWGELGGTVRTRLNDVRRWDPTHPSFAGTYHWPAARELPNADVLGWYDYHWERGIDYHVSNCRTYWQAARKNRSRFYTWLSTSPASSSEKRVLRTRWSLHVGAAFGLKGVLWFLGNEYVDPETLEAKPAAEEIRRIHAELAPLGPELVRLGNPIAVHGTPISRNMKDEPVEGSPLAGGLPAFPSDSWIRCPRGEVVVGVFDPPGVRGELLVASFNAYRGQEVVLEPDEGLTASIFDREEKSWRPLEPREGLVLLELGPGGAALLRLE